jgi:tetratricopeptide (TPR) repeat protein
VGDTGEPDPGARRAPPPGALTALLRAMVAEPTPEDTALRPLAKGDLVGRFEIVRELGRGGFGVVYEAKDRELGRSIALKIVRPGRPGVGESQLAREAEAVARLSHQNLVTLHEVGRSEQGPFLVFELLRGKTLQERIEEGPLELRETVHIGEEVARGLAHAHSEGVVHRDLKPSNVFVTNRGAVKILDFGMAHAFGRRRVSGGTPAYMAPEQWEDNPEDERTDVFALGVMLHRMLAGEYPFPEDGGRWSAGAALAPTLDVPDLPTLGALVGRMLEKVPAGRPRDGAEVLAALEPLEAALTARPVADGVPVKSTQRSGPVSARRRRRPRLAAVIAGATLVAALGGLAWWGSGRLHGGTPPPAAASAPLEPAKGPEVTILVAPFKASDPSVEADARLMDGLVLRALEKFVRRAPMVTVAVASSSPRTEAEARDLGVGAGAPVVLWGNLTALRGELVLEPVLTATRNRRSSWVRNWVLEAYRWKQSDSNAFELRRLDAERIGRPAATAMAAALRDRAAGFAVLDDVGERTEFTELARAQLLRNMSKGREAVQVLRSALSQWPGSFDLRSVLCVTLSDMGEPGLARQELPALAKVATRGEDLIFVAFMLQLAGDSRRAEELAKRALQVSPGDKKVGLFYANMLTKMDRREEARSLVSSSAREPLDLEEADDAAQVLQSLGQAEASRRFSRRLVADEALDPRTRVKNATMLSSALAASDQELAAMGARRAAKDAPDSLAVQVEAGQILLRAGHEDEGVAMLRSALAIAPDSPRALVHLGSALSQREPGRARELLKKAVRPRYLGSEGVTGEREKRNVIAALLAAREPDLALQAIEAQTAREPRSRYPELRCDAEVLAGRQADARATAEAMRSDRALQGWGHVFAFACLVKAGDMAGAQAVLVAAKSSLKEPWLTRIAEHLLGELSEQDFLRLDEGLAEWDAATRRCEANYYAGLARLRPLNGVPDPVAAADRFRASREWRAHCDEATLTEIELHRLEHPSK